MKVYRTIAIDTKNRGFEVGDRIVLNEDYTATCQKIKNNGSEGIFIFDKCLPNMFPMFKTHPSSDENKYEDSWLREYLQSLVKESIFDNVRHLMVPFKKLNGDFVRIATEKEMFGTSEDNRGHQWVLMKNPTNRVSYIESEGIKETWLKNTNNGRNYAVVTITGCSFSEYATNLKGVRPVFKLCNYSLHHSLNEFEGTMMKFGVADCCGRLFSKNCKVSYADKIPVVLANPKNVIGYAKIIENDEGLTATVKLDCDILKDSEYGVVGYYTNVKKDRKRGIMTIEECELKRIVIMDNPADEDLKIRRK